MLSLDEKTIEPKGPKGDTVAGGGNQYNCEGEPGEDERTRHSD